MDIFCGITRKNNGNPHYEIIRNGVVTAINLSAGIPLPWGPNDTALVITTFLMALLEHILLARMLFRWPKGINVGLVSFKKVS